MTKRTEPTPEMQRGGINPEFLKMMKAKGFTAVCFIYRDVSVRVVGSIESWHRSERDAKRFACVLNGIYGPGCYKGVSV